MKNPNARPFLLWTVAILLIVIVIMAIARLNSTTDKKITPVIGTDKTKVEALRADDWVSGSKDAKVVLTEYSDFQCPGCAAMDKILQDFQKSPESNFALVFRHFPLDGHFHSRLAAEATEAAGQQGKFWEMAHLLFAKQTEWGNLADPKDKILSYADSLGLDLNKFQQDWNSLAVKEAVEKDYQEARNLEIQATPTFFLNGKLMQLPRTVNEFKLMLQDVVVN